MIANLMITILIASSPTAMADNLSKVKAFLPSTDFRRLSGNNCPDGTLSWNGEMLIFGSDARPMIFHSFDKLSKDVDEDSEPGVTCENTSQTVVAMSQKNKNEVMTLTQTNKETCGKKTRTMVNTMVAEKLKTKTILSLRTKDTDSKTALNCTYEK